MQTVITYKSHTLTISTSSNPDYTKITNLVNGEAYQEILTKAINAGFHSGTRFVEQERILLNGFLKSVVGFHNQEKRYNSIPFITFNDEAEYYVFCVVNDIIFEEQVWFKTSFIKTNINLASLYIINSSIEFLSMFHPEYIETQIDYIEQIFNKINSDREKEKNKYKCDPNEYHSFLQKNNIKCLYHFTSKKNIESIKSHGLMSMQCLKENNITSDYSSSVQSRDIDSFKSMSDYIHLSYERENPMMYVAIADGRLFEYSIIEISSEVIFWKQTQYTNKNALKSGAVITEDLNFFLNIPFALFHNKNYLSLNPEGKEWFKSEVLVRHHIPAKLIMKGL